MAGALLIKPPMGHLATTPDIYSAGETFVPVRADFSDLRAVCEHYLTHEEERLRITRTALQRYQAYFQEKTFVAQMGEMMARLAVQSGAVTVRRAPAGGGAASLRGP